MSYPLYWLAVASVISLGLLVPEVEPAEQPKPLCIDALYRPSPLRWEPDVET